MICVFTYRGAPKPSRKLFPDFERAYETEEKKKLNNDASNNIEEVFKEKLNNIENINKVVKPKKNQKTSQLDDARGIKNKLVNYEDSESLSFAREMIRHAWTGYSKYTMGADEFKPISLTSRTWMSNSGLHATLIDSLDTLYIAGLRKEFDEAVEYLVKNYNFNQDSYVSFFETTIRILGGLLSAFALSNDKRLVPLAVDIGDRLILAFNNPTEIPFSQINLRTGDGRMMGSLVLAEIGSCQLEFDYLSEITGNPSYKNKAYKALDKVLAMSTSIPGLYPASINPYSNQQSDGQFTIGALADSFYEYLDKIWLMSGKTLGSYRVAYDKAIAAAKSNLLGQNSNGLKYFGVKRYGSLSRDMEHLACFSGGMIALGAYVNQVDNWKEDFDIGAAITETCYQMYHSQPYGISPDKINMDSMKPIDMYYIQRPEAVESESSIFILWRLTHDVKYREWGKEIMQSIEKTLKVEHGYSGLHDVQREKSYNDNQESFFLAETLKYLYLLFADDSVIPFDDFVFNTEAHPLPIHKQ